MLPHNELGSSRPENNLLEVESWLSEVDSECSKPISRIWWYSSDIISSKLKKECGYRRLKWDRWWRFYAKERRFNKEAKVVPSERTFKNKKPYPPINF